MRPPEIPPSAGVLLPTGRFTRFVAVDWSGQAVARPKGLAMAVAETGSDPPALISPQNGWSRENLGEWIARHAAQDMLIGIDLSAGFPFADHGAYFPGWTDSPPDGPALWAMVEAMCRNDAHLGCGTFLAHAQAARHFRQRGELGDLHPPGRGRLRVCEHHQRLAGLSPYSCFNLVGAAQVGKSSLTGMRLFERLRGLVPVWPFDPLPARGAVIVEIYTALAARQAGVGAGRSKLRDARTLDRALAALGSSPHTPMAHYSDHATDALVTAAWLRGVAHKAELWQPEALTGDIARTEGWTFGLP